MKSIAATLILLLAAVANSQTAFVITEKANLRGTASNTGKVVQKLSQAAEVEVIKQKGAWFLVQSVDYVGWIHGNAIRLNEGSHIANEQRESTPDSPRIILIGAEPQLGMTSSEVRSVWGEPKDIQRTTDTRGVSEMWVYERRVIKSTEYGPTAENKRAYVFFTNGRVTSVSN